MSVSVIARAEGLQKAFGDVKALNGIDLEVQSGEILGLLGPNGAGKTTTVKVFTTLERADSGAVSVLGHDVATKPDEVRHEIGYVPQELTADRYLTARESLEFFCRLYHVPKADRKRKIDQLIELVSLQEAADRQLATFSGGMKKKLDLACGLVHDPKLLFLDEPSLGLDVHARRTLWDHILDLKRRGTTMVLCTNYMEEADKLCDRIAVIDKGRVVAIDTPDALRAELGGDVVTIELVGGADQEEQTKAALTALEFVGEVWHEGEKLQVAVDSNETALPLLLDALRAAEVDVRGVGFRRPDLEEVFIRHTGQRFADSHGQSGKPPIRRGQRRRKKNK